jgi:7-carboxy-7-deazaguanine synthase
MSGGKYAVNEIFLSLQGEGVRAGTPNVFVRFSGCNLSCSKEPGPRSPGGFDCDTEFVSGVEMTADEILAEASRLWADRAGSLREAAVIFTGGEPLLQLDGELLAAFKVGSWHTAVETNGSIPLVDRSPLLDWVTVSPKVAEHAVRQLYASEVKYVRGRGQGIPHTRVQAAHRLISPAFDGGVIRQETLSWCIDLVTRNPEWRLSVQQHKTWGVR